MIPEAAVEAAANAISQSSGMRFDGFWSRMEDLEPEDRDYALAEARAALEAAAPHMLAGVEEFGIFRKGGDWHDAPMEKWTFTTRERAECAIRKFNDGESWLEVRSRIAAPWTVAE